MLQYAQGLIGAGVAGELGAVTPLKDLGIYRVRGKQTTRRTITWIRMGVLCSHDYRLDLSRDDPHNAGRREEGSGFTSSSSGANWQEKASGLVFLEPGQ